MAIGITFLEQYEEGPRNSAEGNYLAELDLEQLRRYRESEVHGNTFRRPQRYELLLDLKIEPPFIRSNYRK